MANYWLYAWQSDNSQCISIVTGTTSCGCGPTSLYHMGLLHQFLLGTGECRTCIGSLNPARTFQTHVSIQLDASTLQAQYM
jgi:hypothetical protein